MRNINYAFNPAGTLPHNDVINHRLCPVEDDEVQRLCRLVFAINPKTKLPCSDFQILFSDSVPPEIADWVRKNLQAPQQGVVSSIIDGQQVDDDVILHTTRNIGESDMDYINRVDNYLREINKSKEGN